MQPHCSGWTSRLHALSLGMVNAVITISIWQSICIWRVLVISITGYSICCLMLLVNQWGSKSNAILVEGSPIPAKQPNLPWLLNMMVFPRSTGQRYANAHCMLLQLEHPTLIGLVCGEGTVPKTPTWQWLKALFFMLFCCLFVGLATLSDPAWNSWS